MKGQLRRRRIGPGELPTVYLSMRVWDPALHKMRHLSGHSVVIRNYTPGRVKAIIVDAFRRDIEDQKAKLRLGAVAH